jgi:hypothetical protein
MSLMGWLLPNGSRRATVARSAGRSKNELEGHAKKASYVAPVAKYHLPDAPSSSVRTYSQANARMTVASPLSNAKKPPGNRVAFSLGRIVPTEARPSELSWRHSMGGLLGCQGQMIFTVNDRLYVTCWKCTCLRCAAAHSPFVRVSANRTGYNPPHLFALTM